MAKVPSTTLFSLRQNMVNSIGYSPEDILAAQREEFCGFKSLPYVPRTCEIELRRQAESKLVKVIIGPRRAGKSRLIQKVLENQDVAYINFDDELVQNLPGDRLIKAAHQVYPNARYWYLDEIQDFPNWETLINKLHRRQYNLFVTGSNANLLSTELATVLTGRHIPLELLPFSYDEFCLGTRVSRSWVSFEQYLMYGGFPEVILASTADKSSYLAALFDATILKDLVRRKRIKNPSYLVNCVSLLINNIASRLSARSLSKALKGTPSAITVEKYLGMVAEAYLIELLSSYSAKSKDRILSERKPFAIDTGYITARSQSVFPNFGKQLENAVYLQLRRRGLKPQQSLFFYRSHDGTEVDFLVRNGHQTTELIQACLDMSSLETREREVRGFRVAAKDHPDASLTIVTANESGSIDLGGGSQIKLIPAWKFCSNLD